MQTGAPASRWARFITRVPFVLSRNLWVWPLLGAVLIGLAGWWTRNLVEGTMKTELTSRLQTLLNADVAALRLWFSERESDVRLLASDPRVQQAVAALVRSTQSQATETAPRLSAPARQLEDGLKPLLQPDHFQGFLVTGRDGNVLAAPQHSLIGRPVPEAYAQVIRRAIEVDVTLSRAVVTRPPEPRGHVMLVVTPIRGTNGAGIIGALALRLRPAEEFASIFSAARMGETGEAYAFDRGGRMLTASRFEPDSRTANASTNSADEGAPGTFELVDPGAGEKPDHRKSPAAQPRLTRMAAAATEGLDGADVDGYRNYRGVSVVGAWAWLPEYGVGLATEVAAEEAFQTLYILRRVFLSLFLMLVFSGLGIFVFSLLLERMQASVRKTVVAAGKLGQYVLMQEIGRGANSMVYRARHTLMRRPVAVKLLSPEMTDEANVARFEHEVQMTSQLTHPNTVAVYDYGRTPEGLFYYAMEYLSGIDLHRLVRQFGPQPEGRVIHILRQVCGSLAEAHRIGLIHRDIKPANIILTQRASMYDMVKVLDFGIVKALHLAPRGLALNAVVGTPHFMSPEAVERPEEVDRRSDLYSVGAVGYWLLTGKTLFAGQSVDSLLAKQATEEPTLVWRDYNDGNRTDLQQVIMRCLAKRAEDRPQSAEAMDEDLARCNASAPWQAQDAEQWWRTNLGGVEIVPAATMPEKTLVIAPRG